LSALLLVRAYGFLQTMPLVYDLLGDTQMVHNKSPNTFLVSSISV